MSSLQCRVIVIVAVSGHCGCDSGHRVAVAAPLFLRVVCVQVLLRMGVALERTEGGKGIASAQSAVCKCLCLRGAGEGS